MNNKTIFRFPKFKAIATLAVLAVLVLAIPLTAGAQVISGSVRGTVLTPSGEPAVGATVTVTDTRTSSTRTTTTNANGGFNVRGLAVGGPFTIGVSSDQYKSALLNDVYTNLAAAVTSSSVASGDP